MTKIINFSEELRQKQADDIEKRLFLWLEKTQPCRLAVFLFPPKDCLKHPEFMKWYQESLLLQIQDLLSHVDSDQLFPIGCDKDYTPIFSFFDPTMSYQESHKIRMVTDLVLRTRLGENGTNRFPANQNFFKKCLWLFVEMFLDLKAKIKLVFNFKQ